MIRLAFGFMPRKVVVKLGKASNFTYTAPQQPTRVSCIWDSRLRTRPRHLRLVTRSTRLEITRLSNNHGRNLHA